MKYYLLFEKRNPTMCDNMDEHENCTWNEIDQSQKDKYCWGMSLLPGKGIWLGQDHEPLQLPCSTCCVKSVGQRGWRRWYWVHILFRVDQWTLEKLGLEDRSLIIYSGRFFRHWSIQSNKQFSCGMGLYYCEIPFPLTNPQCCQMK